jgi:dihydrofolate reductase
MARIVAIEHVSLDGVMQAPARGNEDQRAGFMHGGWAAAAGADPLMQQVIGERMGDAWSLLVGRVTYEDLASVWPKMPRPNPMADALDRVEKFVVSATLTEPLPWQNSTLLPGDGAVEEVSRLRREYEKTLIVFGSATLLQTLMLHRMVDEYVLQIHPILLGSGLRLFPAHGPFGKFELIRSETTSAGVIIAVYRTKR